MSHIVEKWKEFCEWQKQPHQVTQKSPELHRCLTCGVMIISVLLAILIHAGYISWHLKKVGSENNIKYSFGQIIRE